MPDNETVTLKTASGELVDVIVPAGMSDAEIKTLVLSKRPDLFSTSAKPAASDTYVQLPNGSYVHIPPDATPAQLMQLKIKLAGMQAQGTQTPDTQTFGGSLHSYLQGAAGQGQTPGANQITGISAQPKPTGWRDSVAKWADDVANDMRNGTSVTTFGALLHKMGAQGTNVGNSPEVGEFMASLPLGALRATKGAAEQTQGKILQGTGNMVGGALQALTIPSAFMGGPATEAGATGVMQASGKLFGNIERAANLFNDVKTAAKATEVPVTDQMYAAASRAMDLSDAGAKGLPRVISKFMQRVTNPDKAPVTWDEARDFYSNVSRLSANEYQNMAPQMSGAVSRFASAFDDSLRATAAAVGKGDEYSQAMQLYSTAKSWQKFGANVWGGIKQALPFAGGAGVGTYLTRKAMEVLDTKSK